jgi:hypothetical protein
MLLNTKVLTVAGRACAPLLAVYEPDSSLSSLEIAVIENTPADILK